MDTATTPAFLGLTQAGTGLWTRGIKGENVIIGILDSGIWPESRSFSDRTGVGAERAGREACLSTDSRLARQVRLGGGDRRIVRREPLQSEADRCAIFLPGERLRQRASARVSVTARLQRPRHAHGVHRGRQRRSASRQARRRCSAASTVLRRARGSPPTRSAGITVKAAAARIPATRWPRSIRPSSTAWTCSISRSPARRRIISTRSKWRSCSPRARACSSPLRPGTAARGEQRGAHQSLARVGRGRDAQPIGHGEGHAWQRRRVHRRVAHSRRRTRPHRAGDGERRRRSRPESPASVLLGRRGGNPVLDPAKVAGKIVVCERGGAAPANARVDKSLAVKNAGGVGAVIYNVAANTVNADLHSLPTVHVDHVDGSGDRDVRELSWCSRDSDAEPGRRHADRSGSGRRGILVTRSQPGRRRRHPEARLHGAGSSTSSLPLRLPATAARTSTSTAAHPCRARTSPASARCSRRPTPTGRRPRNAPRLPPPRMRCRAPGLNLPFNTGSGHVRPNLAENPGIVYDVEYNDYLAFLKGQGLCCAANPSIPASDASDLNQPSLAVGDLARRSDAPPNRDERHQRAGNVHGEHHGARWLFGDGQSRVIGDTGGRESIVRRDHHAHRWPAQHVPFRRADVD